MTINEQRNTRIADAVLTGMDRFWDGVASEFPEVLTGDLSPETVHRLREEMTIAVKDWLVQNHPEWMF